MEIEENNIFAHQYCINNKDQNKEDIMLENTPDNKKNSRRKNKNQKVSNNKKKNIGKEKINFQSENSCQEDKNIKRKKTKAISNLNSKNNNAIKAHRKKYFYQNNKYNESKQWCFPAQSNEENNSNAANISPQSQEGRINSSLYQAIKSIVNDQYEHKVQRISALEFQM